MGENEYAIHEDENNRKLQDSKPKLEYVAFKIAAIYMTIGGLWILLSDKALALITDNLFAVTRISVIKGWLYVLVTGIIIYILVSSALKKLQTAEDKLYISYQKLKQTNRELAMAYEQVDTSRHELRQQYDKLFENQQILQAYEKELQYQAYHDQLTGLQNRRALIKSLDKLVNSKTEGKMALLIVDIDNFKYINDTMGHSFGDQVLIRLSKRLAALVENDTSLYRLSGDEFVIIMEDFADAVEVERLAVKLLKGCEASFDVAGSNIFIATSIGISVYPEHGEDMDELLKSADIAVYKAKETGRNRIVFYNRPMNDALSERVLLEKHLRTALDNNEFELYYQPQLDIETNSVSGLEALIRWKSPELGFISPLKFISVAEDTHLIIPIGAWVLRNACSFIKRLHEQGHGDVSVSVNISMLQLLQEDFVGQVLEVLEGLKLDPKYLELEITESILMESYELIAGKLKHLKQKGIKIALDDFGKGYSSLNYLKQLPISTLKIDKTFIDTISSDGDDKSLMDLIVRIGKTMELCVVAEGVETQEQLDYLIEHQCSKIQGYYFSKPVAEAQVADIIKEQIEGLCRKTYHVE